MTGDWCRGIDIHVEEAEQPLPGLEVQIRHIGVVAALEEERLEMAALVRVRGGYALHADEARIE